MIPQDSLRFLVISNDSLWFLVIPFDSLWFLVIPCVPCGSLWSLVLPCDSSPKHKILGLKNIGSSFFKNIQLWLSRSIFWNQKLTFNQETPHKNIFQHDNLFEHPNCYIVHLLPPSFVHEVDRTPDTYCMKWYFVSIIVLTYCEKKIVQVIKKNFCNSRLKAENLQNVWDY